VEEEENRTRNYNNKEALLKTFLPPITHYAATIYAVHQSSVTRLDPPSASGGKTCG
jgi:hypothetical protein